MADRIERAHEIAESAAAVAESWFRTVGIPDEAIPVLLAEYAKGAPSRDRWERIAQEWLDTEAERVDKEWREKNGLPPWPAPPKPTVVTLREEIRNLQEEWMAGSDDRDNRLWAPCWLDILWSKARRIAGASPPPPLTIPVKQPVHDMQQALGALDDLLRWCDGNKAGRSGDSAAPQPADPKPLLASWREILVALEMKDNREDKQKVARLNETYNGPIVIPGQGRQPLVDKAKLIEWWNNLAVIAQADNRQRDAQATVGAKYDYGRHGKVVPEISGSVKERRRNRKP